MTANRDTYRKYLEVLELRPDASLVEIKRAYLHLKRLYSGGYPEISEILDDLSEEKRREILDEVEEAYAGLLAFLEKEEKKIRRQEKKIGAELAEEAKGELPPEFIERVLKQKGSLLKTENLEKSFSGRKVAKAISLTIRSGEIVGLLGRNGAGKTTTFQMIVGLLKPDRGKIYLDGEEISSRTTSQRAHLGLTYLLQENSVFLKTTVENNLKMMLELYPGRREELESTASRLLEDLGLAPLAHQPAHTLSGGERRKLEICRSLLLNPKFLLLDEPFTGIDPITIIDLQKILLKLRKQGIGILLSDHNVRDTFRIADRAYIIDDGEILVEGNPGEVASSDVARARFLGEDFKLGQEISYSS